MTGWLRGALIGALGLVWSLPAGADSAGELADMVEIMREEGVIDDTQYSQMKAKAEKRDSETHWWERLEFSGDLRVRYEAFTYDQDALGNDRPSRQRARYRARIKVAADINDHIDAVIRIATGQDDNRSTNQTLGSGVDFDPDQIFMDRAYLVVTPWANGALPGGESGYLGVELGRVSNPYHWSKKISPDYLLWDRDIGLEGGQVKASWDVAQSVQAFLNTGYYVIDEESRTDDPGLFAAQAGGHFDVADGVAVGGRFTYFGFHKLDSAFFARGAGVAGGATSAGGNTLVGGLGGQSGLGKDSWVNVIESSAYLAVDFVEDWPVTIFGNFAHNLAAQNTGMGKQDIAWLVGFQTGDKKKWVNTGFLYGEIEADAFPSQFIDSDFTDGKTNRKGLSFWVTRQIFKNTDFKIEAFNGEEIETASPLFDSSTADARRWRVRGDVKVKF